MATIEHHLRRVYDLQSAGKLAQAADLVQQIVRRHPQLAAPWLVGFELMADLDNRPRAMAFLDGYDRCNPSRQKLVPSGQLLTEAGWFHAGIVRETQRFALADLPMIRSEIAFDLMAMHAELGELQHASDWLVRSSQNLTPTDPHHTKIVIDILKNSIHLNNYLGDLDPAAHKEFLSRQLKWSTEFSLHAAASHSPLPPPQPAGAPLRVAFVSPDLHTHSVAYFLAPLLAELDAQRITPHLVSLGAVTDAMTDRLTELAASRGGSFKDLCMSPIGEVIEHCRTAIRADVAIDLAGLTPGNCAEAFASQLAPVQIAWLGYPGSTGLANFHGRIVNEITDPLDTPWWSPEPAIRLPGPFLCYAPPPDVPALPDRTGPDTARRPIAFGSFNIARKIGEKCVQLWAAALRSVPDSTLTIKSANLHDPQSRVRFTSRITSTLEQLGIPDAARRTTVLAPTKTTAQSLGLYNTIDIALDTTPYCGTTTSCEALLMGVPVITLAPPDGPHASRVGASLLHAIAHDELIAASQEQFAIIAASLAADRPRLARLHTTLRQELLNSELCNASLFAERWQTAIERTFAASATGT